MKEKTSSREFLIKPSSVFIRLKIIKDLELLYKQAIYEIEVKNNHILREDVFIILLNYLPTKRISKAD